MSNLGRIKRLAYKRKIIVNSKEQVMTFKEKILKPIQHTNGYYAVSLSKNNIHKIYLIHRLVAEVFLNNPNGYPCVNHKDENKTNNKMSNLEWCTHIYNNNYGKHNKKVAEALSKKVLCIETGIIYESLAEVERQIGVAHNSISKVCLRRKTYSWRLSLGIYLGGEI